MPQDNRPIDSPVQPCPCVTHDFDIALCAAPDVSPRPAWWPADDASAYAGESMSIALGGVDTWDSVRALGAAVDHDNAVMARWLLRSSDNPNWLLRQTAKGLSYLMKALSGLLAAAGLVGVVSFTAIDLFVAVLASNMSKMAEMNADICEAMRQTAAWAGIVIKGASQITAQVVRAILDTMMRVLKPIATQALFLAGTSGVAMSLVIAGASALTGTVI